MRCAFAVSAVGAATAWAQGVEQPQPDMGVVFVRPLLAESGKGRNDASPSWAPGGKLIAFERAEESRREIVIARADGSTVKTVYYQTDEDDLGLGALLPGLGKAASYNSGISWSPAADRFIFMSNAGEGNYDLYLGTLGGKAVQRLTRDPQKDGQPDWSPSGASVVFVSGRSGGAQLYQMDMAGLQARRISNGENSYLYPRWSPDSQRIAAIYGANENHDIVLLDAPMPAKKTEKQSAPEAIVKALPQRSLTTWSHDDLSPSWSPDGKRVAFYSNYNPQNDPKIWSLLVVKADGSDPTEGERLGERVVAFNVIPDVSLGPAWLPDSKRIAYARNDKHDFSPIYIVNVDTRKAVRLETGTNINHDLTISSEGVLAFRAQVDQWDQIFLAALPGDTE